jgi:peptidoglycan/LPS O-acetylase OafA/YrhL
MRNQAVPLGQGSPLLNVCARFAPQLGDMGIVVHRNNFDLWRLFAAAQVVFMHAGGHLKLPIGLPFSAFMWALPGVPIFFIISGYLVLDSALRSTTIDYFRKRSLRIYPALILNILILEVVMVIAGQNIGPDYSQYPLALITYLVTASSTIGGVFTGIPGWYTSGFFPFYPSGVLWTLTIELTFYLCVPLIAAVAFRSLRAGLLLLASIFIASAYLATYFTLDFVAQHTILDVLCPAYMWIFSIGMAFRLLWSRISIAFEGKGLWWLASYILVNLVGYYRGWFEIGIDFHTGTNIVVIARTLFLSATVLSVAYTLPGLSRMILRGNDFSYGIYLWHMLPVTACLALGLTGHWWLWLVVVGFAIAIGAGSWWLIERPSLRYKSSSDVGLRARQIPDLRL